MFPLLVHMYRHVLVYSGDLCISPFMEDISSGH